MLWSYDGSAEFFVGTVYFNPRNGDPPIKITDQREDGLYPLLCLPPANKYKRAIVNIRKQSETFGT